MGASAMALVVAALVGAACLVVAVVASVGSSGSAEAKPRAGAAADNSPLWFKTEDSRSNNISPNTKVTAAAWCPSGYRVISGGFDVHRTDTLWNIIESRPAAGGGWWVSASIDPNQGRRAIKPFTAYAVCAPNSLVPTNGIDYPSRTVQASSGEKELTPPCEASSKAIGGGFDMSNGNRRLIRTQPNPGNGFRSWIVKVNTSGKGGDISAYSVCVREELVKDLKFLQRAQTGRNVINVGTERCPQGTYLLGGGAGRPEGDWGVDWSHIRPGGGNNVVQPKDWAAGAVGPFGFQRTIHAHAMCGELVGPKN